MLAIFHAEQHDVSYFTVKSIPDVYVHCRLKVSTSYLCTLNIGSRLPSEIFMMSQVMLVGGRLIRWIQVRQVKKGVLLSNISYIILHSEAQTCRNKKKNTFLSWRGDSKSIKTGEVSVFVCWIRFRKFEILNVACSVWAQWNWMSGFPMYGGCQLTVYLASLYMTCSTFQILCVD